MQTAGRVVIVTGGSSGIGAATARRFVAAGDTVINFDLVCGTDPRIPWQQVDVSDWDDVTGAVDKIVTDTVILTWPLQTPALAPDTASWKRPKQSFEGF